MSGFKRFIKWMLSGTSHAHQPLDAPINIQNSENKSEFISSRIDRIGSFLCNYLLGISNRTSSSSFDGETGQGVGVSDDAGDFAWSRADFLDADSVSYEIGGELTGYSNFSPLFHNDHHLYGGNIHGVNPANGLPMLDDCIDIYGNPYGADFSDSGSSLWDDHSLDSFGDDGLGVTASSDIFGSNDPWDS